MKPRIVRDPRGVWKVMWFTHTRYFVTWYEALNWTLNALEQCEAERR